MKSKVYLLNDEDFKELIKNHYSYSDCLRVLGLAPSGGSSRTVLKKRIEELNCDTSHFSVGRNGGKANKKYELSEILIENSPYTSRQSLKRRLINEEILEKKCNCCGLTEWLGNPISLQLHHKDGNNKNHSIENIELLCPNCHSQTDTYAGKNNIGH